MKSLRTVLTLLPRLLAVTAFMSIGAYAVGSTNQAEDVSAVGVDISFPTRILPILTKAGCNAGACHGAAVGQGGFKLSLLGYDPESDYDTITRQFAGRRVDFSSPDQSLFLRKATRGIGHKGGQRIKPDSDDYHTLVAWIGESAPFGPRGLRVSGIRVSPSDTLVSGPGQETQLNVIATLSDGSTKDVTGHALFSSNDDAIAGTNDDGAVKVSRRGVTNIVIRYGGQVAAARVGAPFHDAEVDAGSFPPLNFVDREVWTELRRMHLAPSPLSGDAEFLRRVYLDLIGRLPTAADVRSFLAQPSTPARRARVIGQLLERVEFIDLWTSRLSDLLLIDSKRLGEEPARAYHDWVREQVTGNVPFDRVVRKLLTASGELSAVPSANFHRTVQDPRDMGEFVSSAFLGMQIACARCHAHPFAAWTQEDYYGFAAFFARTRQDGSRIVIGDRGEVQYPKTGKDAVPKLLGAAKYVAPANGGDRRAVLAEWITSPGNPYFAKATVNRVWRYLMGYGICEPADDLRVTNPPSNPALLDALAADFAVGGFDLRRLIRTIAESRTYQLSSKSTDENRDDDRLFSHARPKPLQPQVFADAIADATEVPDTYPGYPPGTRTIQLIDSRIPSYELDVLGRCTRDSACDSRSRGGGVSQSLHLLNGSAVNAKLHGGSIDRLLRERAAGSQIVEQLYLQTLSRFPNRQELDFSANELAQAIGANAKRQKIEDVLWALLNSREFAFNH